jgi:hypothetical protein
MLMTWELLRDGGRVLMMLRSGGAVAGFETLGAMLLRLLEDPGVDEISVVADADAPAALRDFLEAAELTAPGFGKELATRYEPQPA